MSVGGYKKGYGDIETGFGQTAALYPGIPAEENVLRWNFIRKVYSILCVQFLLTAAVAVMVVFTPPVRNFFQENPGIMFFIAFVPLFLMCPLYYYHQNHPTNLILLGLFTVAISLTVGISCSLTPGPIVLEALIMTAVVVVTLTVYTYWAAQKGYDFSFLAPILLSCMVILLVFGLIQAFFPLGRVSQTIYGALAALLFSVYIVYDTDNLIKRYTYDEYIWASVAIYLDIINLFLALLQLLRGIGSND